LLKTAFVIPLADVSPAARVHAGVEVGLGEATLAAADVVFR